MNQAASSTDAFRERRGLEKLDRAALADHQLQRLNALLARVLPQNRFYADKLARISRWEPLLQQFGIAQNSGKAVTKLVRDSRRHLTQPGQVVLEQNPLAQTDDFGQIGKEEEGPSSASFRRTERHNVHTEMDFLSVPTTIFDLRTRS